MKTYNIHEAKTQLSRLVQDAASGTPFIIAKSGAPQVVVRAIHAPRQPRRLGFMPQGIQVPDDFDRMGADDIAALFAGAHDGLSAP